MEILEQRKAYTKQAVILARDSYAIGAAFSIGEEALDQRDIRILCVPKEDSDSISAYKKLNYLLANNEDLSPGNSEILSRDPGCVKKKYELTDGFSLTVYVGGKENLDQMKWWRPLFDGMKIVDELDGGKRVSEDVFEGDNVPDADDDGLNGPEPAPADTSGDGSRFKRHDHSDFAEPAAAAAAAVIPMAAPAPEPAPEPVPEKNQEEQEIDENEEYWNFVSAQLKNARHAVAAESYIRANEIFNVLRKMLIELICVRNGIESDFDTAIDYVECEEKDLLLKTYPTQMNKGSFINALSNITTLFDRLA